MVRGARPHPEYPFVVRCSLGAYSWRNRMAETPRATQAADRMQSPVATLKNGSSSSPARQEQDDDAERLRGVVALPRQREILFTDEVELDGGTLPHWRPHIMLDERPCGGSGGDAVGTRQAKPGGELAKRDFAVAAAEPGSDGASDVGISALGQCRSVQAIVFRHRPEDGCGIASGELSRLGRGRIADHRPGQLAKPSQEPLRTKRPAAERLPKRRGWGM